MRKFSVVLDCARCCRGRDVRSRNGMACPGCPPVVGGCRRSFARFGPESCLCHQMGDSAHGGSVHLQQEAVS